MIVVVGYVIVVVLYIYNVIGWGVWDLIICFWWSVIDFIKEVVV